MAIASGSRPAKKQRIQNNNSTGVMQVNDIETREKWLEQEQKAIELLRQRVLLEKELLELKNKNK